MQLRLATKLTSSEYVTQQAWRQASLASCPLHPRGSCGLRRHGSYPRVTPRGARVARYLCPAAGVTFSLLPDCLASRLSSALVAVEEAVVRVEQAPSLEAAADGLRVDVELPGVLCWLRRRVRGVHAALLAVVTLSPHEIHDHSMRGVL